MIAASSEVKKKRTVYQAGKRFNQLSQLTLSCTAYLLCKRGENLLTEQRDSGPDKSDRLLVVDEVQRSR